MHQNAHGPTVLLSTIPCHHVLKEAQSEQSSCLTVCFKFNVKLTNGDEGARGLRISPNPQGQKWLPSISVELLTQCRHRKSQWLPYKWAQRARIEQLDLNHMSGRSWTVNSLKCVYFWIVFNGKKCFWAQGIFFCSTLIAHREKSAHPWVSCRHSEHVKGSTDKWLKQSVTIECLLWHVDETTQSSHAFHNKTL